MVLVITAIQSIRKQWNLLNPVIIHMIDMKADMSQLKIQTFDI